MIRGSVKYTFCVAAILLAMGAAIVYAAEPASIAINGAWTVEGGAGAPVRVESAKVKVDGHEVDGIKLICSSRQKAWNRIRTNVSADLLTYNTLKFMVRTDDSAADLNKNLSVILLDKKGNWSRTTASKYLKEGKDGWAVFSWDAIHQPENVVGFVPEDFSRVGLLYNYGTIPAGKTLTITIADMRLVKGEVATAGDPALYKKWQAWVAGYHPDYSDDKDLLGPPKTGRIAHPIAFIKDGKALGEIIVPPNASEPLTLAGKQLQHWLREITGADVPIVATAGADGSPKIFLGSQFAAGKFDADLKWLKDTGPDKGTDGLAVRADGKDVYIFGATDKGTLNGVFTFLENNTDIIWPRGLVEENVVFTARPSLDIVWADARDMPATKLRGWGIHDPPGMLKWQIRNRNNYIAPEGVVVRSQAEILQRSGNHIQFGGGHNISGYLDKNAAFYPVINGKKVTKFNIWHDQPNFTAPGIVDAVADNVIHYIKTKMPEGIECVNINIEDNWGVSTDPESLAPITLPDGQVIKSDDPAFRSTQYFIFLNAVVKKINQVYPDMTVSTYAYFFTATVPKVAIDPHIRIFFAPYPRKDYRTPLFSPINDHWWRQMLGWTKKTPNVVMREYYGIFNGFRPLAEVVDAEVKSYLAHGITAYTAEISGDATAVRQGALRGDEDGWNFMAQEYWLINRIYWNPDRNIEQLRKYYVRRVYHEAAPEMEKFFGTIRTAWYKQTTPSSFVDSGPAMMESLVIRGGLENELRQDLVKAAAAVKNPMSRFMIQTLRLTFEKWVAEAKEKPAAKSAYEFTPHVELRYGWQPMNDWEQHVPVWALATYIDKDGQAVAATRITTHAERITGKDFRLTNSFKPGLLLMKSGDRLGFVIRPKKGATLSAPLQISLTAIDRDNAKIEASAGAFTKLPDGGLRVNWQLRSDGKFDVAQLKELVLTIPNAVCAGQKQVVFYVTDWAIQRNAK